jgi:competence protein ComEC
MPRRNHVIPVITLLLTLFVTQVLASATVIDRTKKNSEPFAFPENAELLEVWFPKIFGCDATLIKLGEHTILIDSGTDDQAQAVMDMLDMAGVTKLEYIFNTHPDPDHIGGFFTVIKRLPVGEALTGFPDTVASEPRQEMFLLKLAEAGIPARRVQDGETLPFGNAQLLVIQRYNEDIVGVNNNSATLHITFGGSTAYITGDIQMITQQALIAERDKINIQADLLKYPHHGLDRMQPAFLDMASPRMVVMTAGSGDPKTDKSKAQLAAYGVPYYFTSDGVLCFTTDGQTWVIDRFKK